MGEGSAHHNFMVSASSTTGIEIDRAAIVAGCIDARKYGGVVQARAKAWGLWGPMLIQPD